MPSSPSSSRWRLASLPALSGSRVLRRSRVRSVPRSEHPVAVQSGKGSSGALSCFSHLVDTSRSAHVYSARGRTSSGRRSDGSLALVSFWKLCISRTGWLPNRQRPTETSCPTPDRRRRMRTDSPQHATLPRASPNTDWTRRRIEL